jgi:hypothetical protein
MTFCRGIAFREGFTGNIEETGNFREFDGQLVQANCLCCKLGLR